MKRGMLLGITAAIIICWYRYIRMFDREIENFDQQMKAMKTKNKTPTKWA